MWILFSVALAAPGGSSTSRSADPAPAPAPARPPPPAPPIAANHTWQVLAAPTGDLRPSFAAAGEKLGRWTIEVAGVEIDGPKLVAIAQTAPNEPFVRVVREALRMPLDPEDFLYMVDDVLVAGDAGRRGERFVIPMGRARSNGVLVHPDDVFKDDDPKVYPEKTTLAVDEPPPQESFPVAKDGEVLGPNWTMRYRTPTSRSEMYKTLAQSRPAATFSSRIAGLVSQLELQGADVYLTSFLRYRERGYLMWGAYTLRKCSTSSCVSSALTKLSTANRSWAHVPITWKNPAGWQATKESARQMADAYDVVYATESGARYSNHYDGTAADFIAMGLPRTLELYAPNGEHQVFDLSGADQTRDLSLTPELIEWIEENFQLHKLESDHPHWDDTDTEDVPEH